MSRLLQEIKSIQKLVADFRSQGILGRYAKAIPCGKDILTRMNRLLVDSPNISKSLEQLKKSIQQELAALQKIQSSFFGKTNISTHSEANHRSQLTKGNSNQQIPNNSQVAAENVGKWGAGAMRESQMSKSALLSLKLINVQSEAQPSEDVLAFVDKMTIFKPNTDSNLTNISVQELDIPEPIQEAIEEKLVLPYLMPQFYNKLTYRTILLYGRDSHLINHVIQVISVKSTCPVVYLSEIVTGSAEIEFSQNALLDIYQSKMEILGIISYPELLAPEEQARLASMVRLINENKKGRSILILVSNSPWLLDQELDKLLSLHLRIARKRLGSKWMTAQTPEDEYQKQHEIK